MRHLTHLKYIDVVAREGSIRKAADRLAITSTALNRRILGLEEEIGSPIFERLPSGVRLNAAGELFIQHIRLQMNDLSRILSQISDLSGERRGHVAISVCAEMLGDFLPEQIGRYRDEHQAVSFDVMQHDAEAGLAALNQYDADIALIYAPLLPSDVTLAATVSQPLIAQMHHTHPLAQKQSLSIEDMMAYPVIVPRGKDGIRGQIDIGCTRKSVKFAEMIMADNFAFMQHYICHEMAISLQIPFSLHRLASDNTEQMMVSRPIKEGEFPNGVAHIAHLRGRTLPVAAARFLDQIVAALHLLYPDDAT
jgi:DNA-binding transcriptional LysR family regulator